MKKLSILSSLLVIALFISCTGDPGPQGPPGFDGLDGADSLIGTIFEVEADFNANNNYEYLVEIPTNIEVFDTDVVMAYILTGIDNDVDIWEPLPQTLFFENGILLYGFNHTFFDVNFFLDGTVDFANLDALYTNGVVFRVAVIPAAFAETTDLTNLKEVMSAMQIENVERY